MNKTMRAFILLALVWQLISLFNQGFGQVPQEINYQSVVRDQTGSPLINQIVGLQFEVIDSVLNGLLVYQEGHQLTTNGLGLVSTRIGSGNATFGTFSSIDWGTGIYYLRIGLDVNGGNNYATMGTSRLVSVPYSLFSETASNIQGGFDPDTTNEIQALFLNGDTLSLSSSNFILLYDHPIIMTGSSPSDRQIKLVGDPTDTTDVVNVQSLQSGRYLYGVSFGSANSYQLNLNPAVQSLEPGTRISFKANFSNTGPVTLQMNNLGPFPIVKKVNSSLDNGDIISGQIVEVIFDGTVFHAGIGTLGSNFPNQSSNCYTCDGF